MGSNEHCAECGRDGERWWLVARCVGPAKYCPMRNKVEQVDEAGDWISKSSSPETVERISKPPENANQQVDDLLTKPRDAGKIRQPLAPDPTNITLHEKVEDYIYSLSPVEQPADPTNPDHYKQGDVECIEAIKAATIELTGEAAYCTGCAIKYLWRWKRKGGVEDLRKARWYINRLLGE